MYFKSAEFSGYKDSAVCKDKGISLQIIQDWVSSDSTVTMWAMVISGNEVLHFTKYRNNSYRNGSAFGCYA